MPSRAVLKGKRILENVCFGVQAVTREMVGEAYGWHTAYKTILGGGGAFGAALSRRQKRWLAIATERFCAPSTVGFT